MKVLWLTNKVLPAIDEARGGIPSTVNEGWISQVFSQIVADNRIELRVICMGAHANEQGRSSTFSWNILNTGLYEEIHYSSHITEQFIHIIKNFAPDVIHSWGSEYPHTLSLIEAASRLGLREKVVISLQGIVYIYASHYVAGVPAKYLKSRTLYDILRGNSINDQRKRFVTRGNNEISALTQTRNVIGRTIWDYHCAKRLNPIVRYHFCNETLRSEFYTGAWNATQCRKHSIFISQATYPIKGFHFLLMALPKLIERYPDLHVYVAGNDLTSNKGIKERLKMSTYGKYLREIIHRYCLAGHITFLGRLNARQMKEQYLKANVFVSPSIIENSPNSVGEAMMLGCPIVCSDVGGVRDILSSPNEGFVYPYDEFYMIEYYVSKIFDDDTVASQIGSAARSHAIITHNPELNYSRLISIYTSIVTG